MRVATYSGTTAQVNKFMTAIDRLYQKRGIKISAVREGDFVRYSYQHSDHLIELGRQMKCNTSKAKPLPAGRKPPMEIIIHFNHENKIEVLSDGRANVTVVSDRASAKCSSEAELYMEITRAETTPFDSYEREKTIRNILKPHLIRINNDEN